MQLSDSRLRLLTVQPQSICTFSFSAAAYALTEKKQKMEQRDPGTGGVAGELPAGDAARVQSDEQQPGRAGPSVCFNDSPSRSQHSESREESKCREIASDD